MNTPKVGRSKAAKARKGIHSLSYKVSIIGRLWQGNRAPYDYTFDCNPTPLEVKTMAGDFSDILDYQVVQVTSGGSWEYQWTHRKVVKAWEHEDSETEYLSSTAFGEN